MAKVKEKPKPTPVSITSLRQLETRPIIVTLERYSGDSDVPDLIEIELDTLTYGQWEAVGRLVPLPVPQAIGGRDGVTYDTKNPDYLRAINEADRKRLLYRLAAAIRLEDMPPKEDLEARSQALLELDMQVVESLLFVLMQTHQGKMAQVTARADSFQRNGQSHTPDS